MARQQIRRIRRPKGDLCQRLTAYSTAAGALLALGGGTALISMEPAEAAVQYSGLKNYVMQSNSRTVIMGSLSVMFHHRNTANLPTSWSRTALFSGVQVVGGANKIVPGGETLVIPSVYGSSAIISSLNFVAPMTNYSGAVLGLSVQTIGGGTQTVPAKSGFVGIRFKDSVNPSQWHYGWIRVSVSSDIKKFVVVDYAYETTPDTPIHIVAPKVGGVVHDISDTADSQ